jgi:tryptophan synthase alpha chain
LIPLVPLGYPSLEITRQLVPVIARQGADLILLGTPFGDPPAGVDLPGWRRHSAPRQELSLDDCMSVAAEARRANEIPLLFVSNHDLVRRYGLSEFAVSSAASGVDGLIVPDLPLEQAADLRAACEVAGIDLVLLVDSNSPDELVERVAGTASGFIGLIAATAVTAERMELQTGLHELASRLRAYTDLPLAAGFDISTPEQVSWITGFADGAIIGNALFDVIAGLPEDEIILGVAEYVRALKEATAKQVD